MNPEKLLAAIMLVSLTFGAGLEVDMDHIKAILKNLGLLGRALLANFVVVPILGLLTVRLFQLSAPVATGVLLMAIAPGVPFVLAQARKRGGRLALAVELAVVLPLLSIVTVPITAAWVLPPGAAAQLPLRQFAVTLILFQLLPLLAGVAVGTRFPETAARIRRPVQVVFLLTVIGVLAVLAQQIVRSIVSVYGSRGMLAMLTIDVLAIGTGWLLGGPAREDRRILALGTALRNVGLGALIAATTFPDPQVAATVLIYLLIQMIVTSLVGVYFTRTAKAATV